MKDNTFFELCMALATNKEVDVLYWYTGKPETRFLCKLRQVINGVAVGKYKAIIKC